MKRLAVIFLGVGLGVAGPACSVYADVKTAVLPHKAPVLTDMQQDRMNELKEFEKADLKPLVDQETVLQKKLKAKITGQRKKEPHKSRGQIIKEPKLQATQKAIDAIHGRMNAIRASYTEREQAILTPAQRAASLKQKN